MSLKFDVSFPEDPWSGNFWILNSFTVDSTEEDMALLLELENELIELSEDSTLKLQHQEVGLSAFWIKASKGYPLLSERAIKFLLPFTLTYLCESGFSTITKTKSKSRNSLKTAVLNATMRVSLFPITQNKIECLLS